MSPSCIPPTGFPWSSTTQVPYYLFTLLHERSSKLNHLIGMPPASSVATETADTLQIYGYHATTSDHKGGALPCLDSPTTSSFVVYQKSLCVCTKGFVLIMTG
jgi:hypothetical protein